MAIDVRELRLGNWVYKVYAPYGPEQSRELIQIDIEEMKRACGVLSVNSFYHDPIPLSADLLLACGFEDEGGEFQHPENTDFDLMFCCSENGLWCAYNFSKSTVGMSPFPETNLGIEANPICNPFKYLHQLQNLYFSLTGKELTYTNTSK